MPNSTENNKTMLGVDSDNNGIRDDIDIWINRTGKSYNERMALRQWARAEQYKLKVCMENDRPNSSKSCQEAADASVCHLVLVKNKDFFYSDIVSNLTRNTSQRESCYKFFESAGCSYGLNKNNGTKNCKFDLI